MNDIPPKRRRRRSSMDRIFAREQGMLAMETRRIAVLAHVAEALAELNAMLREAGLGQQKLALVTPWDYERADQAARQVAAEHGARLLPPVSRPCTWCGLPGVPTNVGNGVVQDLCQRHAALIGAQQRADAVVQQKTGYSVDHTDARPPLAVAPPQGKVVMQPTQADVRAAEQHATQANGQPQVQTPPGFEELEE